MPDERDFLIDFAHGVRMRVRFLRDRKEIREFVVQLETWIGGQWLAVVRYDNAHGRPHLDILDRWGREKQKYWLLGTNNDVLTEGVSDIRQHWEQYLSRFMEERK